MTEKVKDRMSRLDRSEQPVWVQSGLSPCRNSFKYANHPVALVTATVPDPSIVWEAILADIRIACGPGAAS